jgi:hypothetical protein
LADVYTKSASDARYVDLTSNQSIAGNKNFAGNTLYVDDTNDRVGVGTASPTAKLHVVNGDVTFVTNDANGYSRITQNSGSAQLGLFRSGSGSTGGGYIGGDGDSCLDVRDSAFVSRLRVAQNGQLQGVVAGTSTMRNIYGCHAWVNFDGTGSNGSQSIRASGGVTSIVKTNTGTYTMNFATAMPDTNYCPLAWDVNYGMGWYDSPFSVGSFQFRRVNNSYNLTDTTIITVAVFR